MILCSRCGVEVKERIKSCYFCGNEIHLHDGNQEGMNQQIQGRRKQEEINHIEEQSKGEEQQVMSQVQEAEHEEKRWNKSAVPFAIACLLVVIIVAATVIDWTGFERFDFEEYIVEQLESMDRTSRTEIDDWIRTHKDDSDMTIVTKFIDTDGNDLDVDWWDRRAGFVEWRLDFSERRRTVSLTYLFDLEKADDPSRFWFGEAFMYNGFRITIHDHIHWRGENYFKLDVTMENISSEFSFLIPSFSLFGPNGESLSGIPTITTSDIRFTPVEEGEVVEGFLYFRYVGPGDYVIALWNFEDINASMEGYITVSYWNNTD